MTVQIILFAVACTKTFTKINLQKETNQKACLYSKTAPSKMQNCGKKTAFPFISPFPVLVGLNTRQERKSVPFFLCGFTRDQALHWRNRRENQGGKISCQIYTNKPRYIKKKFTEDW